MIVCVCNAITERDIDEAVADGATSMQALQDSLRVSSQCGSCSGCAEACLERALSERSPSRALLPLVATTEPLPA